MAVYDNDMRYGEESASDGCDSDMCGQHDE